MRFVVCVLALGLSSNLFAAEDHGAFHPASVEVYFSPHGGATEACVASIARARASIAVQAYSFTSKPIAAALVAAKKRGVVVVAILDKSQLTANYSEADFLAHAGIAVLIDSKHAIAHNKVMLIDRAVVITGSFNFTTAAEHSNAENLLVIHDTQLAARYLKIWYEHKAHSESYGGK